MSAGLHDGPSTAVEQITPTEDLQFSISPLCPEMVAARFPMFDVSSEFSPHTDHGSGGTYNRSTLG